MNMYQSNTSWKRLKLANGCWKWFKRGSKWRTNSPAYLFLQLIQQFQVATTSTSLDMTTVFHTWLYGRFIEILSNLRGKKLHRTTQGSNFLGGSFSNRDNVRAPIQFRREGQPKHLKRWFFLKNRPIHFHINRTSVIWPVKQNQLSFPCTEINKLLLAPVHSVSYFNFRGQFKLLPHIRCLITLRIESSIISIYSNITDNIIKVTMYSRKSVGPRMDPWGTPALTGYSCEHLPSRTTRSHLFPRKEKIRPNICPEIP